MSYKRNYYIVENIWDYEGRAIIQKKENTTLVFRRSEPLDYVIQVDEDGNELQRVYIGHGMIIVWKQPLEEYKWNF